MKRCSKCKKEKAVDQFHKNRSAKDGYCGWCKSCQLQSSNRYAQSIRGKAIVRRYQRSEQGKAALKRNCRNQYRYYPQKTGARMMVNGAILCGIVFSPKGMLSLLAYP